jgi:hypothetical protein
LLYYGCHDVNHKLIADFDLKRWICGWENPLEVGEMDYSPLLIFGVEFWDEPIAAASRLVNL